MNLSAVEKMKSSCLFSLLECRDQDCLVFSCVATDTVLVDMSPAMIDHVTSLNVLQSLEKAQKVEFLPSIYRTGH